MRAVYLRGPESDRFWPKVDKSGECWIWTAAKNEHGYGIFRLASKSNRRAHIWAYEQERSPVPEGLELDHLCRNRACVNPDHLEPVTHAENSRRGLPGRRSWRRERTHCKNGHEFTPDNVYRDARGYRLCVACRRAAGRRSNQKRAA